MTPEPYSRAADRQVLAQLIGAWEVTARGEHAPPFLVLQHVRGRCALEVVENDVHGAGIELPEICFGGLAGATTGVHELGADLLGH